MSAMKNLIAELVTIETSFTAIKSMMNLDTAPLADDASPSVLPVTQVAQEIDYRLLRDEINYRKLAEEIDASEVAGHIEIEARDIAEHIEVDASDVASHLSDSDIASEIDLSSLAEYVEVEASEVAQHVDLHELADCISMSNLAGHVEFDYDTLAAAVGTRAIAQELHMADIAAEIDCDDIAVELSTDDRFIDGVAEVLMKNEAFIAAIAAKVLAGLVAPHIKAEQVDEVPHGQRDTFIPAPAARSLETMPTVALACGHDSLNADMRCTTCGAEA